MQQSVQRTKSVHSPTLATVQMVEDTIMNDPEGIGLFSVARLKRVLPRKVNHNTLLEILDYLQRNRKIYITTKGIIPLTVWTPEMERMSMPVPEWLAPQKKHKKRH